jgi:undecaprenyl-diphosphatase
MKKILNYFEDLQQRPYLTVIIGLAVSALLLALFSKIASETLYENEMHGFDSAVTSFIRYPAGQALNSFMLSVTKLGSSQVMLAVTMIMLAVFILRSWRREAIALLICLAGAGVLNQMLKILFARSRPEWFALVEETGYSFPSGHSMVSICVYGFLAYVFSRNFSSIRKRGLIFLIVGIVVAMIGISRIYLGVHYPTDVLAGFVAGGTWLGFCMSWLHWREYRAGR